MQPAETSHIPFSFHGRGGPLLKLYLVTFLLSIVTVGIYSFWGRTRIRKYIASSVELLGDRFQYHGTGKELLRGWIIAMVLLAMLVGQMFLWQYLLGQKDGDVVGAVILFLGVMLVTPLALVGSWRYRLSRTSWREIRFRFAGKTGEFFKIFFLGMLLSIVTLTLYTPWFATRIHRFLVDNAYFGNAKFNFDGNGRELFKPYVIALLLAIPTLFISMYWYQVKQTNYFFDHTTFLSARFSLRLTLMEFLGIFLASYMLIIVTLGLGFPWAQCMGLRYVFSRLSLFGNLPLEKVHQILAPATATGDELSDLLDAGGVDISLGL